jgi:tRNA-splicing ligase RtcB
MELHAAVAAALAGDRHALAYLARRRFDWPKAEVTLLGRCEPDATARLQEQARRLIAPRSGAAIVPAIVGQHDTAVLEQLRRCLDHDDAVAGALCANGHIAHSHPIGAAVAYREHISVLGVGLDIARGGLAVKTDMRFRDVKDRIKEVLDEVDNFVVFDGGHFLWVDNVRRKEMSDKLFDDSEAWRAADASHLIYRGLDQFGTIGAGDHHVALYREMEEHMPEADSTVWVGVQTGSRGFGGRLAANYLERGGGRLGADAPPTLLHQDTDLGRGYLAALDLAGRYAAANRVRVAEIVLDSLEAREVDRVHNIHNFAWREEVAGAPAWVMRKGCVPAMPGERVYIGASAGDDAVIVEGVAGAANTALLATRISGGGRVMSRGDARRRKFTHAQMVAWFQERDIVRRAGRLNDSPLVQRQLADVLPAHASSVRVLRTLRPFAIAMAGEEPEGGR